MSDRYWMLECHRSDEGGRSIESWPDFPGIASWVTGERFKAGPPKPIVLYWDPEDEEGEHRQFYLVPGGQAGKTKGIGFRRGKSLFA